MLRPDETELARLKLLVKSCVARWLEEEGGMGELPAFLLGLAGGITLVSLWGEDVVGKEPGVIDAMAQREAWYWLGQMGDITAEIRGAIDGFGPRRN